MDRNLSYFIKKISTRGCVINDGIFIFRWTNHLMPPTAKIYLYCDMNFTLTHFGAQQHTKLDRSISVWGSIIAASQSQSKIWIILLTRWWKCTNLFAHGVHIDLCVLGFLWMDYCSLLLCESVSGVTRAGRRAGSLQRYENPEQKNTVPSGQQLTKIYCSIIMLLYKNKTHLLLDI